MKSERTVFLCDVEECSSAALLESGKCLLNPAWRPLKPERTVSLCGVEECSSGARLSSCKCLLESTWGALKSERTIFFVLELPACVASLSAGCDTVCDGVGVEWMSIVPAPEGSGVSAL